MARKAFKMFLNKGAEAEYKKRHEETWPEIKNLLKDAGFSNYSIFLDEETNVLFGVLNYDDEIRYQNISLQPIMQKWWDYMKDLMETNKDNSPQSADLTEVFYLK